VDEELVGTTRATYDLIAAEYAAANREVPASVRESLDRFLTALVPDGVVADVGCGPGRDLAELRRGGARAFGFDLSLGMLRAGRHAGVVQAEMSRLPIRTASLDGLWCAAAFLHIPRRRGPSVMAEFARTTRPGGVLHLSVSEGEGQAAEPRSYGVVATRLFVHHDQGELMDLLPEVGFEVTSVHRSESHRRWLTIGAVRRPD
jgi:SAM-dependent methyltransferase